MRTDRRCEAKYSLFLILRDAPDSHINCGMVSNVVTLTSIVNGLASWYGVFSTSGPVHAVTLEARNSVSVYAIVLSIINLWRRTKSP